MTRLGTWLSVGVAAVAVVVVGAISVANWDIVGNSGISLTGWIALILGFVVTMAVGVGLMALVFISNRRGYDDPPGGRKIDDR